MISGLYSYSVLVIALLVAVVGVACGGGQAAAPGKTATPMAMETRVATEATAATSMSTVATESVATSTVLSGPMSPKAVLDTSDADSKAAIYETLLAIIPDTPDVRVYLHISDYALARQMFSASTFPLPEPGDDDEAVAAFNSWLPPMSREEIGVVAPNLSFMGISPFFSLSSNSIDLQHFAFDIRNMDQIITTGLSGYDVVRGRFNSEVADATLKACIECPAPGIEEHRGITFYSWGEDYAASRELQNSPPAFDHLGRGGRFAILEEYVIRTLGTPEMKAAIDAHLKEVPSIADVREFQLLVKGMSQLVVYGMFLTDGVELWELSNYAKALAGPDASQADVEANKRELAAAGPWLRPYDAFGVGGGKDKEGPYMALALAHTSGNFAEENVGLLRRVIEEASSALYDVPWSDEIDINNLEINAEGPLLLAKIRGPIVASGLQWVNFVDNLILHEQK